MKIEMFEKVGEIVIAELRSASENKEIALIEKARQEEEERKRKEEEERKKEEARLAEELKQKEEQEKAKSTLLLIIEAINATAEKGETVLSLDWHGGKDAETKYGFSIYQYNTCLKYFKSVLESAGYTVDEIYWYSTSWRYKSGRIGYAFINW